MLAVIVVLVIAFIAYVAGGNGQWGAVAVTAVIGVCVLIGVYGMRREDKAFWDHINGRSSNRRSGRGMNPRNVKLKKGQSLDDVLREMSGGRRNNGRRW